MLTDTAIKNLKPAATHRFVADANGLYVRVHPTGRKSWVYRSRVGGKAKWESLGEYPAMSLAAARKAAAVAAQPKTAVVTLQTAYDDWVVLIRKEYKSPAQVEWRCEKYLLPVVGSREVAGITRAEMSELLTALASKTPILANRVLTDAKLLFNYCVARGWIEDSPCDRIMAKMIGGKEKSRARVLDDAELRYLGLTLMSNRFASQTRLALAIALLTGKRSAEVRGLVQSEVLTKLWELPAHRAKNGIASLTPVSTPVDKLMRLAFTLHGSVPFDGMPGQVLSRAMTRMRFTTPATPHDLRRTMATWMGENGVAPHIIESCLDHKLPGVAGVYNRAVYIKEKAAAYRLWARHILRLIKKKPPAVAAGG